LSKEEFWRLPIVYVLGALGAVVGAFMSLLFMPLSDRVDRVEDAQHEASKERAEMKRDLYYLEKKQ
jgi:gas vesicle protein